MAVTKTPLVSILIVLAITYNQGAARTTFITKNGLSSSEEDQTDSGGDKTYLIPTVIQKGLIITIKGTIDTNDTTFIVELPSISGKESCRIKFDYIGDKIIYITPAVEDYANTYYDLNVASGSAVGPTFSLKIVARMDTQQNNAMFGMIFEHEDIGPSSQLICQIENFEDINQIVIKKGVAHVDSLLFEFESNH